MQSDIKEDKATLLDYLQCGLINRKYTLMNTFVKNIFYR